MEFWDTVELAENSLGYAVQVMMGKEPKAESFENVIRLIEKYGSSMQVCLQGAPEESQQAILDITVQMLSDWDDPDLETTLVVVATLAEVFTFRHWKRLPGLWKISEEGGIRWERE